MLKVAETPIPGTSSASWCWFSSPSAIVVPETGNIVFGYVTSTGQTTLASFDPNRHASRRFMLGDFETDDHNNPSIAAIGPNRLLIAYSRHNRDNKIRLRFARTDLEKLSDEIVLTTSRGVVTYSQLHAFDDLIVLAYRVAPREPRDKPRFWVFRLSDDLGSSWSEERFVIDFGEGQQGYLVSAQRPGTEGTVDILLSAHPAHGVPVDLLHLSIDFTSEAPPTAIDIPPSGVVGDADSRLTPVFTSLEQDERPWAWDVTNDQHSTKVLFTSYDPDLQHSYRYGSIDHRTGRSSTTHLTSMDEGIADSREPFYSGGLGFVHSDEQGIRCVCSVKVGTQWVLQHWYTYDDGATWESESLELGADAFRPQSLQLSNDRVAVLYLTGEYGFYKEFKTALRFLEFSVRSS